MPNNAAANSRVLFVDDDAAFLQMVEQAFGSLSKGSWEIHLATDAAKALSVLKEQPIDLTVLDVNMPGVSGLELLNVLNRDHPDLQKVFLTGLADEQTRITGLEGGAELFLEKPGNLTDMESVFATLDELVRWQKKQGARGARRPAGLLDVIKMECMSGNSRLFDVFSENARGQIFIKEGVIMHAQADGRRGQSAFTHLASQPDAEFNLKQFVDPPERSIDRQWEFLVLEAFRMQEQLLQVAAEIKAKEAAKHIATPPARTTTPPSPARATTTPKPPVAAEPATAASTPALPSLAPPTPQPATKTEPLAPLPPLRMVSPTDGLSAPVVGFELRSPGVLPAPGAPVSVEPAALNPAPALLRLAASGDRSAFRIEEMLVCSKQREVLYEWACAQTDVRVRFIEHISQKFHQAASGLPLGRFDRIEMQSAESRIVVHFQGDAGLLVRSNTMGLRKSAPAAKSNASVAVWLNRSSEVSGALAAGVVRGDLTPVTRAISSELSEEPLNALFRQIAETFELSNQWRFSAWQARLIYEGAQVYCVRRTDRSVFGVVLIKEPELLDAEGAEKLIDDCEQYRTS
ncbi:MAG TPA: response regulator [Verrucomicrobiae bacterium]|nr:response regulator [Verrucomicrobiae bacterium]